MDAARHLASALQRWLLPWRCLLCGDAGTEGVDLCAACMAELPRNTHCCARCALPLPVSAPQCGRCLRKAPPWDAAWAPFRYAWPLDRLETRFKFGRDLAAGRVLAQVWRQELSRALPQLILPVPLHRLRLRQRGYNQALELARPLAKSLSVPCRSDLLQRTRHTEAQTSLTAIERRRNLRNAFVMRKDVQLPAHVVLLDDVFTTGTTLDACTRVLKRAGVERVDVWALARAPMPGR
jgi:ComF family protein